MPRSLVHGCPPDGNSNARMAGEGSHCVANDLPLGHQSPVVEDTGQNASRHHVYRIGAAAHTADPAVERRQEGGTTRVPANSHTTCQTYIGDHGCEADGTQDRAHNMVHKQGKQTCAGGDGGRLSALIGFAGVINNGLAPGVKTHPFSAASAASAFSACMKCTKPAPLPLLVALFMKTRDNAIFPYGINMLSRSSSFQCSVIR